MVFTSGKKSYLYPKPLTKSCVTLIMPNVLIGNFFFFKCKKKNTNIKNDDKAKLLNHVGKAVIIFCIKLFYIKFATMYIIVENKITELLCYVINTQTSSIRVAY